MANVAKKLSKKSQQSLDSLKEEEESLESKPSVAQIEQVDKSENSMTPTPDRPPALKIDSKAPTPQPPGSSGLSMMNEGLNSVEQEAQVAMTPLIMKKDSLVKNISHQQNFMDDQFKKNSELMQKNFELEERIMEIEKILQAREETKEEQHEPTEGDELPGQPSEERTNESIAGKSSRLGHIERRLELLEVNGPRSKLSRGETAEPIDGGKSLEMKKSVNVETKGSLPKLDDNQGSREERSRSVLSNIRGQAESALDLAENKLQITAVSANFTKLEELVNKIDQRVKILADKQ